jgi:hypothetical protein
LVSLTIFKQFLTISRLNIIMKKLQLTFTKFSRATSHIRWLKGEKNNVSRTISILSDQYLTWLVARENFIILSHHESYRSYFTWLPLQVSTKRSTGIFFYWSSHNFCDIQQTIKEIKLFPQYYNFSWRHNLGSSLSVLGK